MNKGVLAMGALALLLIGFYVLSNKQTKRTVSEEPDTTVNVNDVIEKEMDISKPELTIDQAKNYTATLTTSEGEIKINLFADKTPLTVNNFVYLASKGFYNKTIFHRVISGFMIQGGDPNGNGSGGPGYKFDDEPFEGEYKRGTVAMANAGPNTNGSQFFIMHKDYPLPANYVIFAEVVEGIEVVDKIAESEVTMSPSGENSKPVTPVTIESVAIAEK